MKFTTLVFALTACLLLTSSISRKLKRDPKKVEPCSILVENTYVCGNACLAHLSQDNAQTCNIKDNELNFKITDEKGIFTLTYNNFKHGLVKDGQTKVRCIVKIPSTGQTFCGNTTRELCFYAKGGYNYNNKECDSSEKKIIFNPEKTTSDTKVLVITNKQ